MADFSKEGTVYEMIDLISRKHMVMKVFSPKKSKKAIEKEIRFQRQFHPFAPAVVASGSNYFIMEKGIPLKTILQNGRGDRDLLNRFLIQFGRLLDFQMEKKIAHNDTKLDNLVVINKKLCFIDFGFSKKVKSQKDILKTASFSLMKLSRELEAFFPKRDLQPIACIENWVARECGIVPLLRYAGSHV